MEINQNSELRQKAFATYLVEKEEGRFYNSVKLEGKLDGRREGRLEGRRDYQVQIVKILLADNSPIDYICKLSGLTSTEVLKIAKRSNSALKKGNGKTNKGNGKSDPKD